MCFSLCLSSARSVSSERNKKCGHYVELLSNALVQAPNGLYTKQEHRRFGDNLFVQEPFRAFCWSIRLHIRGVDIGKAFNRADCYVERVEDPSDQVRRVPSSC